jgi:heme exporter protein D
MEEVKGGSTRFSRERYVWMAVSATLMALIVVCALHYHRLGNKLEAMENEREVLLDKIEASAGQTLLTSRDRVQLQRPQEDIVLDLMEHKDLIPYKGVLGGTMGFYSQKDIHVLTSRWVLASFEDGHIGGHMLLEYAVSPEGAIQWKVISAYLD